ncbi:MAG: hypothetical protein ABMA13_23725, partial [Chthoniobacteraceae bacterium]
MNDPITLTPAAMTAGFTGGGGAAALAANTTVTSIVVSLLDQNDSFTVTGLTDPLTVDTGDGTADSIVIAGAVNVNGALTLTAESLTIGGAVSGVTTATFTADAVAISAAVTASGSAFLQPVTAGRNMNLGTNDAGSLSLTDAELDFITAPSGLRIGNAAAGVVTVSAAMTITGSATLTILGSGVTNNGPGAISVGSLAVSVLASITLNGANDVNNFSAATSSADQLISFTDADGFSVGNAGGIVGVNVPTGGVAVFDAGPVTQTSPISAAALSLRGAGPYTLTNPLNNAGTLSASVTGGALSYTDADALTIGNAGGVGGLFAQNFPITIATVDGALTINNAGAGTDVLALTGSVSLTAGSAAGQDRALTIAAASGVSGSGGITLTADAMSLGASVNAGAGIVTLAGFDDATKINLGSADLPANLGLTDAEIDLVTAGTLRIGKAAGGNITILDVITPANVATVSLRSAGNVLEFTGGLSGVNLAVDAGGAVNLNHLAVPMAAVRAGTSVFLLSTGTLAIGTVDGITGIDGAASVNIVSDDVDIQAAVVCTMGGVSISATTGVDMNLGSGAAGYTLTAAELDFITASQLGLGGNGGSVFVNTAIAPANVPFVILNGATISGAGSLTVPDLFANATTSIALDGANDVDTLQASVEADGGTISFADADGFTAFIGEDDHFFDATLDAGTATVTLGNITLHLTATGSERITVLGGVDLAGVSLDPEVTFAPAPGTEFILIANDGTDAVIGAFDQLPDGALVLFDGVEFQIRYTGGDGNDVSLIVPSPLAATVAPGGKSATFRDVDGDLVTVKTNKGVFTGAEFSGVTLGANGAGQLRALTLGAGFTGANITFTAKPSAQGGNGFVNVGFLDANGVDLGAVKIPGGLGLIKAGTVGGDVKVPGVKSLTVQSLGLLGISTQAPGGDTDSNIQGALPLLDIKGDLRASLDVRGKPDGKIGVAKIGGSMVSGDDEPLKLFGEAGIGSLKIGGDIRTGGEGVLITSDVAIGAITVGGAITGAETAPVILNAFGQLFAPTKGVDLAIKSLTVKGSVNFAIIRAGLGDGEVNTDASIGAITVGGDWISSSASVGVSGGTDGLIGNDDDVKLPAFGGGVRDNAAILSTIGSFTVKGQALGTAADTNDMFGIVAERIGKARVGGRTFAFKADTATVQHRETFFAAPTLDGAGAENPAFDFTIRELGSATPILAPADANRNVAADDKSFTFTDVDGDFVTVKRSAGTFGPGDITITDIGIGGQLTALNIGAAPGNAPVNLTITAKPGINGGNGLVNIGALTANGVPLGTVRIAGDIAEFDGGFAVGKKPGVASFTAHSIGALGTSTGAGDNDLFFFGGAGKLTVLADVRGARLVGIGPLPGFGAVRIGGAMSGAELAGESGLGPVTIGGSVILATISGDTAIGAITIGGDLVGNGTGQTIEAFGQFTAPAKGLDLAIKSLTVKGSVERARIVAGELNADAAIGAISVGRAWIA